MKRAFQLAVCLFLALVAISFEDLTPFPRDSGATADEMVTLFQTHLQRGFGSMGLMDRNSKVIIKPEYCGIEVHGNIVSARGSDGMGVFTTDGVSLAPCIFDYVIIEGQKHRWTSIDRGDEPAKKKPEPGLPLILASNWYEGTAAWDGLALRIDGTPLLSAEYRFRELIGDKYLLAARILDGKLRVFDAEGRDVGGRDFDGFERPYHAHRTQDMTVPWYLAELMERLPDPPLMLMRAGGKLLVYNASFQRLSDAEFDEVGGYSDGMLSVRIGSRWGFVDAESKLAIPPRFDWASAFFEGFCVVAARLLPNGELDPDDLTNPAQQGKRPYDVPLGYIDKKGDFLLKPQFKWADDFENGIARTSTTSASMFSSTFTYYDKSGQKIVPDKMMLGHYELLGDRIIRDSNRLLHWKNNGELIVYYSVYATYDAKSGIVFFEEQGCKGFIDPRHRFVWSTTCEEIKPFAEGLLLVKEKGKARLISYSGQQVGPDYAEVGKLSEGFALFRMLGSCKSGYINEQGLVAIQSDFFTGKPFSNSRAAVYKDGWGYIDRLGRWVIPPIYEDAEANVGGLASVELGGKWGGIDAEGKQVFPFLYPGPLGFFGNFTTFSADSYWGYLDKTGQEIGEPKADWVSEFVSGIAAAEINGKRGLIDARGNWVLAPVYHQILPVGEGRFAFSRAPLNGKLGLMQADGKIICEPLFDEVGKFSEGRLKVMLTLYDDKKWGFVDVEGKWVVPPIYLEVKDFREGLAAVQVTDVGGARWGYIDHDGKTVVTPCYFSAESFSEGYAVVGDAGKYGYIDRKGDIALEIKFYRADSFHLGTASVSAGDGRMLINVRGEGIPLTDVAEIREPVAAGYIAAGTLFEWKNRRYGVISPTGKWLVEALFQYMDPGDGTFPLAATKDGMACIVNADGSVIAVDSRDIRYLGCGYFACSQKDGERVIDRTGKVIFSTPFSVFKAQEVPLPGPASGKGK